MSVSPTSQRNVVGRLTRSPRAFANAAALPGRVQRMHTSGQSLYMMRVSPTLRLVHTLVGDTIYVVDLVERATLDRFAIRKAAKKAVKAEGEKKESKSAVQKSPDVVKK